MIYAIARLNILGMLPILIEKTERSDTANLQSSIPAARVGYCNLLPRQLGLDDVLQLGINIFRQRWRRIFLGPELVEFVPAFDRLKLIRGWAGLYAVNTLDQNPILGERPMVKGLFLANGFARHGLQQAPAVGRYLSGVDYRSKTFDGSIHIQARPDSERQADQRRWLRDRVKARYEIEMKC
jgi:hypothetical protein